MSLKELTKRNHSNAERSWFAGRMFSGQITNPEYAIYLKQQYESYKALEDIHDTYGRVIGNDAIQLRQRLEQMLKQDVKRKVLNWDEVWSTL